MLTPREAGLFAGAALVYGLLLLVLLVAFGLWGPVEWSGP